MAEEVHPRSLQILLRCMSQQLAVRPDGANQVVQIARQVRVLIADRMGSGLQTSVTADAGRRIKLEVRYGKSATIELLEPHVDAIREALVELIEALQSAVDDPDGISP